MISNSHFQFILQIDIEVTYLHIYIYARNVLFRCNSIACDTGIHNHKLVDIKIHAETKRKKKKLVWFALYKTITYCQFNKKSPHRHRPFFSSFIIDVFNSFFILVHLLLLVVFNYCLSKGVNYVVFFSSLIEVA